MRKTIAFLLCLISTIILRAQDKNEFDFTFNHLALSVKNLDASVDFYKRVFQFKEIENRTAIEGIRWLSMGEGKELHLISIIKEPVAINKAVHLAVTTQNFDAFTKHLDGLNIEYSDFAGKAHAVNVRADGVKQIYFKDPDGYWAEVNNGYSADPAKKE